MEVQGALHSSYFRSQRWLGVGVGEVASEVAVQKLLEFLNFLGREGSGKESRKSIFFQAFVAKKGDLDSIQQRRFFFSWVLGLFVYLIFPFLIEN